MSQPYQPSTSPVSNTPIVNPFIPPQQNVNPTNATNPSSGSQTNSNIINPTPINTNPTTSTMQQSSSSSLIQQKSDNVSLFLNFLYFISIEYHLIFRWI